MSLGKYLKTFQRLSNCHDKWKEKACSILIMNHQPLNAHETACKSFYFSQAQGNRKYFKYGFWTVGFIGFSSYLIYKIKCPVVLAELDLKVERPDEKVYSMKEVEKHNKKENGIWVTFKGGVYDVTEFVNEHPGGDKILLAAGGSVEPFWLIYGVHNTPEVLELLEKYRIGSLNVTDQEERTAAAVLEDPYAADPSRHPVLRPASIKPFNAEPPPELLVDSFHTPNAIFYVRNHLPVPKIDVDEYRLQIGGIGIRSSSLSLDSLKKFPKHTVSATIQCAGNRRSEMTQVKPVKGLSWGHAAIANATWSGARLVDVLRYCGLHDEGKIEHVQFEGLDVGVGDVRYSASVPAEKALDPKGDVILAYEMNGEPLPRDHGFPLRVIVPGVVGARNVKWVGKIILSDKESDSQWQQNDYKGFSPSVDWDTVDFKSSPAIQELPVISAICSPANGDNVEPIDGAVMIKGYAWSGGGKKIIRVDVSADRGKTWHVADLEQREEKPPRHWAWTLWTANIPVENGSDEVELWAKAVDSSYNTQPESFDNIWNLRGVLSNAYHKVKIHVKS